MLIPLLHIANVAVETGQTDAFKVDFLVCFNMPTLTQRLTVIYQTAIIGLTLLSPPEFAMMVSILNQHSGLIEMNAAFFDEVLVGLSVALRNHPFSFTSSHTVF